MDWATFTNQLIIKCRQQRIPTSACFELTPYCNFNCNMCYIHLTPEQAKKQGNLLNTDQWIHFAEETKRLGTLGLEVTGGEPVTRPDFSDLYTAFIKMGYLISLRSNGYLLCDNVLRILAEYKPRCIRITLYGASDETYKKVCGISDGFSVVTKNIIALRDMGITPQLTVTMTKDNIHDRDQLLSWARSNGFFISFYGGLINPIRSAKRSIESLKVDYRPRFVDTEINTPNRTIENREKYMHPFWMCREFGTKFCISWDGRMTLCNCLPAVWSDPLTFGIRTAFESLYTQLDKVRRPKECSVCQYIDYCGACPARFLSETGSLETTCESLCKKAKINYILSQSNETDGVDLANPISKSTINREDTLNED